MSQWVIFFNNKCIYYHGYLTRGRLAPGSFGSCDANDMHTESKKKAGSALAVETMTWHST